MPRWISRSFAPALLAGALALSPALAAQAQWFTLTSDCEDGRSVCRREQPGAPADSDARPASEAAPETVEAATLATAGATGVISLSNADLERSPSELATLLDDAPAEAAAEVTDDAPETAVEPWGEATPTRDEVWTSVDSGGVVAQSVDGPSLDFETCMERAIRGQVAFTAARRVCEVLFPEPDAEEDAARDPAG